MVRTWEGSTYWSLDGSGERAVGDQDDSQSLGRQNVRKEKKKTGIMKGELGEETNLLVKDSEVFVCLSVPLVVLYWVIEADGFEGGFLPRGYDVPPYAAPGEVIEG